MQNQQQLNIPASSLDFLKQLQQNNNRDWFNSHKEDYLQQLEIIEKFAYGLLAELNIHDVIETPSGKKALQRIYRDTRFSADKTPYKKYWGGGFTRATSQRRGGYYFHLESGNTFVAGGFWAPNAQDLKRVREDINYDAAPLRKILSSKLFTSTFGTLQGEQVKTSPKGFDATHEAIDLLRYKQFLLIKRFTDEEVTSPSFLKEASQAYKNMRPFFDYMSEVLTTNSNGQPI
ncbi:hypothetical protein Q765_18805 [Flavobacterium rivuli WB 3.3-2 = DSM 21788]|uniref:TIGR02453 family protein n=1 Tax=Flavobacterium rivuli WB 3.3-2 = DSM 21788 TaxID=1121895 RepID=A0A0A2M0F3_9FLAO|nr:DUF2461 domain-containing protein [Flavobacterium rivuli]KGO84958.1 hypothetical protein Q765_18805 [Flavobacterium rivuli WB 3.3-2 = DSM 21788]